MGDPEETPPPTGWEPHVILEKMYDTFVKYLDLTTVRPFLQDQEVPFNDPADLLNWIIDAEEDEQPERCKVFINALRAADNEGNQNVLKGNTEGRVVNKYTGMLISTLDGDLIRHLSKDSAKSIAEDLMAKGLVSQKNLEEMLHKLEVQRPDQTFMDIFFKIKRGKVDWPFWFLESVIKAQPSTKSKVTGGASVAEEASGHFGLSDLSVNIFDVPRSLHDRNEIKHGFQTKAQVTPEEYKNMQYLIDTGALLPEQLTIESEIKQDPLNDMDIQAGFSDDDEEKFESERPEKASVQDLKLRKYQEELAETALTGRNTIICAPTGSGKTRVSTYIILRHLQRDDCKTKKVAFLARTVPLVLQQYKSLQKFLPHYKIGQVTGENELRNKVHILLPELHVVVMTPQILENHINRNDLKMGHFSLIVFDECHHARKDEPYNTLMLKYLKTKLYKPSEHLPQIVGLTASIGIGEAVREDAAVNNILEICGNLDCDNISMVHDNLEELKEKVPVPTEEIKDLRQQASDPFTGALEGLMKWLEDQVDKHASHLNAHSVSAVDAGQFVKEIKELLQKIRRAPRKSQQYNQLVVNLKSAAKSIPIYDRDRETNMSVRCLIILTDYLKEYNFALDAYDLVAIDDILEYLEKSFQKYRKNERRTKGETEYYEIFQGLKKDLIKYLERKPFKQNPNLIILAKTLREHLIEKGEKTCGIVFVRTRALCYALVSWLNKCQYPELQKLNAQMFTGSGATARQLGMTQADQELVIQQFRNGETRLLVATTVAEEGLDVPDCNLVIKYNHVGNEVTTVQTRGRSRKKGGTSVLLAMGKIRDKEIVNQGKARLMQTALEKIRQKSSQEIKEKNKQYQEKLMIDAEKNNLLKQRTKQDYKDAKFRMVCNLCRKVSIDSENIRTIEGIHRVVIGSSFWENVQIFPYDDPYIVDDIRMLGAVRCKGEPEVGKFCYNHLGSMILYSKTAFIVLGVKNFGFEAESRAGTQLSHYKKWKCVPYKVEELDLQDIKRHLNLPDTSDDSGYQDAGISQAVYESPTQMELSNSDEKGEGTQVKTVEPLNSNDETHPKQVALGEQALETQQLKDSGLFSGTSQQNLSFDDTTVKQVIFEQLQQQQSGTLVGSKNASEPRNATVFLENSPSAVQVTQPQIIYQTVTPDMGISPYNSSPGYHSTKVIGGSILQRGVECVKLLEEADQILGPSLNLDSIQSSLEELQGNPCNDNDETNLLDMKTSLDSSVSSCSGQSLKLEISCSTEPSHSGESHPVRPDQHHTREMPVASSSLSTFGNATIGMPLEARHDINESINRNLYSAMRSQSNPDNSGIGGPP